MPHLASTNQLTATDFTPVNGRLHEEASSMDVHVFEYILALSVLLMASFRHKSQAASAETIV